MEEVTTQMEWWVSLALILVASALIAWGCRTIALRWEKEDGVSTKVTIASDIVGVVLAAAIGTLMGCALWTWPMGLAVGVAGGFGSPFVMRYADKVASKRLGGTP